MRCKPHQVTLGKVQYKPQENHLDNLLQEMVEAQELDLGWAMVWVVVLEQVAHICPCTSVENQLDHLLTVAIHRTKERSLSGGS